MKRLLLFIVTLCPIAIVSAQDVATLIVNGQGVTKEIATTNALRSAIEQAFGVFVSANTEIMNDNLVKEEIATMSSGNIQKYEEISCINMANGEISVTLSATVAIGKLVAYVKSKGSTAEFAGQHFAMNMKINELNEQNEVKALQHAQHQLRELAEHMFDLKLSVGYPTLANDGNYRLNMIVTLQSNEASDAFYKTFYGILQSLSLDSAQTFGYALLNIPTYPIYIEEKQGSSYSYTQRYCYRSKYVYDFLEDVNYILRAAIMGFKIVETNDVNRSYSFIENKPNISEFVSKDIVRIAQLNDDYIVFNYDRHVPEWRGISISNFSRYGVRVIKKKKSQEPLIRKNDILSHYINIIVEKDRIGSIAGFEVVRSPKYRVDVECMPNQTLYLGDGKYICTYHGRYSQGRSRHNLQNINTGVYLTDKYCTYKEALNITRVYSEYGLVVSNEYGHKRTVDKQGKLKEIVDLNIPVGLRTIEDRAFQYCDSLQRVTIPNSVTRIGERAFCGCPLLESVMIPESVISIGEYAFSCTSVVLCKATTPPSIERSGSVFASDCIIYVPEASVEKYKDKWERYASNIVGYVLTEP